MSNAWATLASASGLPDLPLITSHLLNSDTIRAMHAAFREGGEVAIRKVMCNQSAIFLKLLVLLVPREMRVEHSGGVKSMSDEQLEAAIEAIQRMLEARDAGANAKVIEGVAEPVAFPAPRKAKRKARKSDQSVGPVVGSADESENS